MDYLREIGATRFSAPRPISNQNYTNQLKFGQDIPAQGNSTQKSQDTAEKKKNPWSLKNITNWGGVALAAAIMGYGALVSHRLPEEKKLLEKTTALKKAVEANKADLEEKLGILNGTAEKGNFWYRAGAWIDQKKKKLGDELTNNIIYGIGTVLVMPFVIYFSPIGKKDSTQEERWFAIFRQPLSFATMFAMQQTFDKLTKNYMPKVTKSNALEIHKDILDEKGNLKKDQNGLLEHPNKVFFNAEELEGHFKDMFKKDDRYKNTLSEAEVKNILLYGDIPEKMDSVFKETLSKKGLNKGTEEEIKAVFNNFKAVKNRSKMTGNTISIVANVVVSQIIGCTLLNVIYGKCMKLYEKHARPYVVKNEFLHKLILGNDAKEVKPENKQQTAVKGGDK